jgi:GTP-binding protein Era
LTRSGFVAVAGRPNVGKSTLVNAIVGAKVAVTSDKPQTTRRALRGVASGEQDGEAWELVLVDLPGVQRPRDELTKRMQRRVDAELSGCDAALFVLSAGERIGGGDRFLARALASAPVPVVAALNKVDLLDSGTTLTALEAVGRLEREGARFEEIFPVSARTGQGVGALVGALSSMLPEGPLHYPPGDRSDQPEELLLADLVREQALARTRDEIPHSIEVRVEEIERQPELSNVRAVLWVESESQKAILIGKGGQMIKAIGTAARREMEERLGAHVFLDLTVKIRKGWRQDEALLDRLEI